MIKVLFVCMGNICRSPTAEGVFRQLVREAALDNKIHTDSAGTHAYHVGSAPDRRAQDTALIRGVDLSDLRARKVVAEDFETFHYVLAMDKDNYALLADICPPGKTERLKMFLDFAPHIDATDVPDPYYGGAGGFERVYSMVEAASSGLLEDIRKRYF